MKILFVASNLQALGGIQAYNRKLSETFRELGAHLRLIELKQPNLGQKIYFVLRFSVEILFNRPNFIVITNLNYSPLGFFAKKFLNVPYSITFHGIEARNINKKLHRKGVLAADLIIKVFEETGRNILRQFPGIGSKMLAMPNPVDTERFEIKPKREDLVARFNLKNSKIILTICRMSRLDGDNKGYKRVIQSMSDILKKIPDAIYLLAGGGDDAQDAKELVDELGLKNKVVFTGKVTDEEMVDFYSLGDVFALPSKNEGFPAIVLLESLACGVPVVGGAQPGAKESFHNKYGLIVEPDSISDIAEAIVKVLKGEVPRSILSRESLRNKLMEEYGPEAYRAAAEKVLKAIRKT